ncbi:hypothetical protein V2J09_014851 [Rumex salicifolius]
MIISSSRDKFIILWDLTKEDTVYGVPRRRLTGHSDSVEDVVLSSDFSNCQFALSGSKDGELRLWDLDTGTNVRRFIGHISDVLSVAISMTTVTSFPHPVNASTQSRTAMVSCVRLSPTTFKPTIVSCSSDKTVKIWNLSNCRLRKTLEGHDCHVKPVTISPECSLCAGGGDDGVILLWDPCPKDDDKYIYSLDAGDVINALCFHPFEYWLTVATESSVQIWDLESKTIFQELTPDLDEEDTTSGSSREEVIYSCWSADGETLFSGYNNGGRY